MEFCKKNNFFSQRRFVKVFNKNFEYVILQLEGKTGCIMGWCNQDFTAKNAFFWILHEIILKISFGFLVN